MVEIAPHFAKIGERVPAEMFTIGSAGKIDNTSIVQTMQGFYMTDPISRASRTMAKCVSDIKGEEEAAA